jgi:hypothetical protein
MMRKLKGLICTVLDYFRAKTQIVVTIKCTQAELVRVKRAWALDGKTDQDALDEIFADLLRDRREKPRPKVQPVYDH